jgi:hypothetical protein
MKKDTDNTNNSPVTPRKRSPVSIADILNRDRKPINKKMIKNEWQAFAFKVYKDLGGEKKELARHIRHFKIYEPKCRGYLEKAYQFAIDYQGKIPKLTMFYWKFWRLYKKTDN